MWNERAFQTGDEIAGEGTERHRVVAFLARGGYSEVYEIESLATGARHAVKALRLERAGDARSLERQRREARALYAIRHPNLVRVHFVGVRSHDALVYMIMDRLVGRTLRELQTDLAGSVPVAWALEVLIRVCAALETVHQHAVHRDLKPENIHVGDDGHTRLFDLGTSKFPREARLTTTDVAVGTARYMSPEQLARPSSIDGRSDLFAVGVILYELLAGRHPFAGDAAADNIRVLGDKILQQPHPSLTQAAPHTPDHVVRIVDQLLEKDPARRPRSAAAAQGLLDASLARLGREMGARPQLSLRAAISTVARRRPDAEETIHTPSERRGFGTVPLAPGWRPKPPTAPRPPEQAGNRRFYLPPTPLPARATKDGAAVPASDADEAPTPRVALVMTDPPRILTPGEPMRPTLVTTRRAGRWALVAFQHARLGLGALALLGAAIAAAAFGPAALALSTRPPPRAAGPIGTAAARPPPGPVQPALLSAQSLPVPTVVPVFDLPAEPVVEPAGSAAPGPTVAASAPAPVKPRAPRLLRPKQPILPGGEKAEF